MWAMGNEVMMPYIRERFEKQQPMGEFHREALHYFRQYLSTPYVLHTKDMEAKDGLVYLPLYMTSLL